MSLESNKTLSGIGAILVALGSFVPFLGLVGIILVLVGMKGLADYYNEPGIFQNALYGFIFGIIGIISAGVVLVSMFFGGLFGRAMMGSGGILGFSLVSLILALVVLFIFFLLEAIFYKKSFNMIAEKSGEKMFDTAGILLLIGAVLTIVIIGLILILIAWILAAVAFFSIRVTPPSPTGPAPPPPPQHNITLHLDKNHSALTNFSC